jgi:hypothetical protein
VDASLKYGSQQGKEGRSFGLLRTDQKSPSGEIFLMKSKQEPKKRWQRETILRFSSYGKAACSYLEESIT